MSPAVPAARRCRTSFMSRLPEHDTTLGPDLGGHGAWGRRPALAAARAHRSARCRSGRARQPSTAGRRRAHQRFERLLRETGVFAGVLIETIGDGERYPELRLIYAPRGETSGHLSFPLRALATVAGRPMLGGLKLLLDSFRLFTDADDRRLPALLKKSREAQAAVSTALAEQVLGALHELLRGLDAAEPDLVRDLARQPARASL